MNWTFVDSLPDKNGDDILFTSATNGIFISVKLYQTSDGGVTWRDPGIGSGGFFNLFFTDAQHGFAETLTHLLITNDGGNSWKAVTLPTTGAQTIFFVNPAEGFYGDYHGGGLMKSIDSGKTWVNIFNDPGAAQGFYPFFVNADTGFVAMASGNFASTTDGGKNWQTGKGVLPAESITTDLCPVVFHRPEHWFLWIFRWRLQNIEWRSILATGSFCHEAFPVSSQRNPFCRCQYRLLYGRFDYL